MKIPFVGLLGVSSDGTLHAPSGKRLCRVHPKLAFRIQAIQHAIALWTWKHQPT